MEVLKLEQTAETKQERERIITLNGGVELTLTHLDGTKETVKVRQIPATKLEQFMNKIADESVSVAIYCDKPVEWVDTLTLESINDVCEKGLEINEAFLGKWCSRRAKWTEMLNVGIIADLQRKLQALNEVLASVSSAQKLHTSIDSRPSK
jgi:hypothetical protein